MAIRKVLVGLLAVVGGFVLVVVIVVAALAAFYWPRLDPALPEKIILEADFEEGLDEVRGHDSLAALLRERRPTVQETLEALERGSEDDRVVALIARVGASGMGLAKIQELRNAVLAFRGKGKPAIAHAETFGEFGAGNGAYYLATAFDRIYIQPSGDLGLVGLANRSPFVRGTLEKLGIAPRLDHRHEYKTAMNLFTEREFTEAHREAASALIQSHFGQMTAGIAEARGLHQDRVRVLVDRGPFLAREAVDAGLLDGVAYRDEIEGMARKRTDERAQVLSLRKYQQRTAAREDREAPVIALIYGVGPVHRGESGFSHPLGEVTMGSKTVAQAFRDATEDEDVRAVLFRVDSPGGSYVASDTIWRETVRTRGAEKPVVVSMGDVAASGGYFVSMGANLIVAQPATVTGSIGVLAGKPVMTEFWRKLGVTWDEVRTSDRAGMWSSTREYTPEEWERFQGWLDHVYNDFVARAAEGRNLSLDAMHKAARGRIWTGEDAKALGLVDELGGFPEALRLAKEAAGIPGEVRVRLKRFPQRRSLMEILGRSLFGTPDSKTFSLTVDPAEELVSVLTPLGRAMGLIPPPGVLTAPEVDTRY